MAEMLRGDEWTVRGWARARLQLDDDLGREAGGIPLLEEIRIVAALVALACVVILLV
jgi:hypothetical protein